MSKNGATQKSDDIEATPEAFEDAKKSLGEDFLKMLHDRFVCFSTTGDTQLSKADMSVLLKAVFGPSTTKIEKVMEFFNMVGGSEGAINVDNFINGMTLLYGDLGQLAASPKLRSASAELASPTLEHRSPTGQYAQRGEDAIFGSPLAPPLNESIEAEKRTMSPTDPLPDTALDLGRSEAEPTP